MVADKLRVVVDRVARNDDLVIRLRMAGLSYREIARQLKLNTADGAMNRYRSARARQIPAEHLPRPLPRPPEAVVIWAAGFFDGEGCVFGYEGVTRGPHGGWGRFSFGVTVSQVVRAPMDELARGWGGSVSPRPTRNPRHQDQFHWGLRGRAAATFLADIAPHLRVKRRAAEVAIPCLYRTHGKGVPYSGDELAERRAAVLTLSDLNNSKGRRARLLNERGWVS